MRKKCVVYWILAVCCLFLAGCSCKGKEPVGDNSENRDLDKVVLEKVNNCCTEIMTLYFRGENVTKIEMKETYSNQDEAIKAYDSYNSSDVYTNTKKSGVNVGYEYTQKSAGELFKGYRRKTDVISECTSNKGYTIK